MVGFKTLFPIHTWFDMKKKFLSWKMHIKTNFLLRSYTLIFQCTYHLLPLFHFSCKICGKIFTKSFLIYRHMSSHGGHKDFKCGVCGIVNKSSEDLKIHLKTHDPDDIKYSHCCELCGKRYYTLQK